MSASRGASCSSAFFCPAAAHVADVTPERRPARRRSRARIQLATEAGHGDSEAGRQCLRRGVAVSAALAVVEPSSSGLGGGGFWLLHRARDGFETMVDAREVAPLAATRDMFLDEKGNVVRGRSTTTALAAGIPGEPAGFAHIAAKYGRLPLKTSLQPAIRLAREGFPLNARLRGGIEAKRDHVQRRCRGESLSAQTAQVPAVGTLDPSTGAGANAEGARGAGRGWVLQGSGREALVDGVQKLGGIWSLRGSRRVTRSRNASRWSATIAARGSSRRRRLRRAASR